MAAKPSSTFRALESELRQLELHFLPRRFAPLQQMTRRQSEMVRAYYLLSHAAIEQYIEQRSLLVANAAVDRFRANGRTCGVTVAMVAFWHVVKNQEPVFRKDRKYDKFDAVVFKAHSQYAQYVKKNHGVKEENICKLLVPIGFSDASFDRIWLNAMDSFGERRGAMAHMTLRQLTVQTLPDPVEARREVGNLLRTPGGGGLFDVDQQMDAHLR